MCAGFTFPSKSTLAVRQVTAKKDQIGVRAEAPGTPATSVEIDMVAKANAYTAPLTFGTVVQMPPRMRKGTRERQVEGEDDAGRMACVDDDLWELAGGDKAERLSSRSTHGSHHLVDAQERTRLRAARKYPVT